MLQNVNEQRATRSGGGSGGGGVSGTRVGRSGSGRGERERLAPAGLSRSPTFGVPLAESVDSGVRLPWVVLQTVAVLTERGFEAEGLFRLSGSAARINAIRRLYDSGRASQALDALRNEGDVHTVAGVLKLWLRDLPESLLTPALLPAWLDTGAIEPLLGRVRVRAGFFLLLLLFSLLLLLLFIYSFCVMLFLILGTT